VLRTRMAWKTMRIDKGHRTALSLGNDVDCTDCAPPLI
jgi:hypothetical protein